MSTIVRPGVLTLSLFLLCGCGSREAQERADKAEKALKEARDRADAAEKALKDLQDKQINDQNLARLQVDALQQARAESEQALQEAAQTRAESERARKQADEARKQAEEAEKQARDALNASLKFKKAQDEQEKKWAKGVASDFLSLVFDHRNNEAGGFMSEDFRKRAGVLQDWRWGPMEESTSLVAQWSIHEEQFNPESREVLIQGTWTTKKNPSVMRSFSLRLIQDKDAKWRVDAFVAK